MAKTDPMKEFLRSEGYEFEYNITSRPIPQPGRVAQYVSLLEQSLAEEKILGFAILPVMREDRDRVTNYEVWLKKGPNWKASEEERQKAATKNILGP